MAGNGDGPRAQPGQDPYEIEWPDDSKEMRAAERAKAAKKAEVVPAPRYFTAAVIGVGVVLGFIAPVAVTMGDLRFLVSITLPIVIGGVLLAFPIGVLLERISRTWRTGLPEMAFLSIGILIGFGWTYAAITIFEQYLFADPESARFFRSIASIFMGTAVASAFLGAKFWTDTARYHPKWVYAGAAAIGVMTIFSIIVIFFQPA